MKSHLNKNELTGIVLAGGKSGRMGVDKGLIVWKGKPFAQYSIEALRPFCDHILIITGNSEYARFGLPLVKDEYPNIGPMGGLHAGLKASNSKHHIVLSCDMPLVDEEIIRLLLTGSKNCQAVVPAVDNKIIPVCAYYHSSALPLLEKEIRASLHKTVLFLKRLRFKELQTDDPELKKKFFNINTFEDLECLSSR